MRWIVLGVGFVLGVAACGHGEDFGKDRPRPSDLVGNECNDDNDCEQYCAEGPEFPDGFCTLSGCRSNEECPDGTVCIKMGEGLCLYPCSEPADCTSDFLERSGYSCRRRDGYSTEDTSTVRYSVCIGR